MIEKNVTAAIADEKIKQLYETAFPEDEQIPWKDLMRLVEEMPLDFTAYYDGEEFIGFTIVYPRKSINWFWYFAVCEELRGKGYGQKILLGLIVGICFWVYGYRHENLWMQWGVWLYMFSMLD